MQRQTLCPLQVSHDGDDEVDGDDDDDGDDVDDEVDVYKGTIVN